MQTALSFYNQKFIRFHMDYFNRPFMHGIFVEFGFRSYLQNIVETKMNTFSLLS